MQIHNLIDIATSLLTGHEAHSQLAIIGEVIGGIGSLLGGIFGGNAKAEQEKRAQQFYEQAVNELRSVGVPDEQARIQALQQMQTQLQGDTQYDQIQEDPQLRQAQIAALSGLQGVVDSGGMTLQDQANLAKIQGENAVKEKGARDALLLQQAQRGTSGSGFELAAQLANQQGAATRNSQQGMDVAAQAQARALEALMQKGQLGGQVRGQDFSQAAQRAQAQDLINRFNTGQQTNMQQYKFGTESDLRQNQFANELAKQQAVANATNKQASNAQLQSTTAGIPAEKTGQGIGQLGTSFEDYLLGKKKV